MAETAEQDKKQEPERRHQEMLKKLNVVVYKGAFPASSDDIQIFEIDGVKCIAVYRVGLSCDYNDKHLADKQKRIQAKEKEYQRLLGQPENDWTRKSYDEYKIIAKHIEGLGYYYTYLGDVGERYLRISWYW